ncbi:MAG: histidine phosphatase family protein [Acidimicrobiales bacterium]|jgi:8-oxo-dGTP diphosphatase
MARVSIYVVRHAHAHPREGWGGSDRHRPLTERGVKEAEALTRRFETDLPGEPPKKRGGRAREPRPTLLLSSGAERCLATLRPLAAACELPIVIAEFLSEGAEPAEFLLKVNELATTGGVPVLCTHGDVIWGAVELLQAAGARFASPPEVRKGSVLILEAESGSIETARYIPPDKV